MMLPQAAFRSNARGTQEGVLYSIGIHPAGSKPGCVPGCWCTRPDGLPETYSVFAIKQIDANAGGSQ
jgi:hypothetical protein